MNNIDLVGKILSKFETQAVEDLAEMDRSLNSGDAEKSTRIAHTLKGVAGNLSALSLRQAAAQLEQLLRESKLGEANAGLDALRVELQRCIEYVPKAKARITDMRSTQ